MKNYRFSFLLAIFLFMWASDLLAYRIYLRGKVLVQSFPVRLKDTGRIDGNSRPAILQKIVLKEASKPVYISAADFKKALENGPEKLDRIFGAGIWIVPLTRTLTADAIKRSLERKLASYPGGEDFLQKHVIQIDENAILKTPQQHAGLKYRLPASLRSFSHGRRVLAVDLLSTEKSGKRIQILHRQQVSLKILRKIKLAVATRALQAGHRLRKGDYKFIEKLMDGDIKAYATSKLLGRRVMQPVKEGETLLRSVVQTVPTIRRGQQLTLVVQKPGLVIKARSVAMKDAEEGEIIPVRVLLPEGQSKNLKARIVDDEHAVLE